MRKLCMRKEGGIRASCLAHRRYAAQVSHEFLHYEVWNLFQTVQVPISVCQEITAEARSGIFK